MARNHYKKKKKQTNSNKKQQTHKITKTTQRYHNIKSHNNQKPQTIPVEKTSHGRRVDQRDVAVAYKIIIRQKTENSNVVTNTSKKEKNTNRSTKAKY